MSLPLDHRHTPRPAEDRLIDRLVDGELSESERRELLLRLEHEPHGWRRCALAFLEAQNWREAFGPLAAPPVAATRPVMTSRHPRPTLRSWRVVARRTGLAASLAAAFLLGWAFRGGSKAMAPHTSIAQKPVSEPAASSDVPQPAPASVATREAGPSSQSAAASAALDPMIKRWEQRGFHAETQKRLVALELKDGRKLNVPIQEVRLRYVGGHTY